VVSDSGIIIPLKERIRDLETINELTKKRMVSLDKKSRTRIKLLKT